MSPNQLNVTMATVARQAGVSRATASRVLSGDTRVAPQSAKRVREAAVKLGYVRNAAAAQLARRQSSLVGLLLRDATNPAYAYLQDQLITCAKERGLFLVSVSTGTTDHDTDTTFSETSHVLRFLELRPAGLIVSSGMIATDNIETIAAQVPTLVVPRPESSPHLFAVGYDEEANAQLIAAQVVECGHRSVAVVTNNVSQTEQMRATVIERTLRSSGVRVVRIDSEHLQHDHAAIATHVAHCVDAGECTCVMFPNDTRAIEFLIRAHEWGWDIPGKVSVTGLDGIGNAVRLAGLTTVRNPLERVASVAIDTIAALMEGREHRPHKQLFTGVLMDGTTLADLTDKTDAKTNASLKVADRYAPHTLNTLTRSTSQSPAHAMGTVASSEDLS